MLLHVLGPPGWFRVQRGQTDDSVNPDELFKKVRLSSTFLLRAQTKKEFLKKHLKHHSPQIFCSRKIITLIYPIEIRGGEMYLIFLMHQKVFWFHTGTMLHETNPKTMLSNDLPET